MQVLDRTKQAIIDAGFSHIKLELEANLGRGDDDDYYSDCDECDGGGRHECGNCNGEGALESEEYIGRALRHTWIECDDCYGEGDVECSYCDGSGRTESGSRWENEDCADFITNHVSIEAAMALTFGKFYYDGSVDSEYTFTLPVDKAQYLPEYIDAFKKLGDEIGNGIDVDGAGMHISVIPAESNGMYPNCVSQISTPRMNNFIRQVKKMLPALYFAASADKHSRGLSYRSPRVSNSEKYSAIYTHNRTCLEYRVFETCYDRPEAIFDYMEVIANTLKFLDPSVQVPELGMQFVFPQEGRSLERFFNTPEQMRVLARTIKYIKPAKKSFRQMKLERDMHHNIGSLAVAHKRRVNELRLDYQELQRNNERLKTAPLNSHEEDRVRDYMRYGDTRESAIIRARNIVEMSFETFVNRNIRRDRYVTVNV